MFVRRSLGCRCRCFAPLKRISQSLRCLRRYQSQLFADSLVNATDNVVPGVMDDLDFLTSLESQLMSSNDSNIKSTAVDVNSTVTSSTAAAPFDADATARQLLDLLPADGSLLPLTFVPSDVIDLESIADHSSSLLAFVRNYESMFTLSSSEDGGGQRARWYIGRRHRTAAPPPAFHSLPPDRSQQHSARVGRKEQVVPDAICGSISSAAAQIALRICEVTNAAGRPLEMFDLRSRLASDPDAAPALHTVERTYGSLRRAIRTDAALMDRVALSLDGVHCGDRRLVGESMSCTLPSSTAAQPIVLEKVAEYSDDAWNVELDLDNEDSKPPGYDDEAAIEREAAACKLEDLRGSAAPEALSNVGQKDAVVRESADVGRKCLNMMGISIPAAPIFSPKPAKAKPLAAPPTGFKSGVTRIAVKPRTPPPAAIRTPPSVQGATRDVETTSTLDALIALVPTFPVPVDSIQITAELNRTGLPLRKLLRRFPLWFALDPVMGTVSLAPSAAHHPLKGSADQLHAQHAPQQRRAEGSDIYVLLSTDAASRLWSDLPVGSSSSCLRDIREHNTPMFEFLSSNLDRLAKAFVILQIPPSSSTPQRSDDDVVVALRPLWLSPSAQGDFGVGRVPQSGAPHQDLCEVLIKSLKPLWMPLERWLSRLDPACRAALTALLSAMGHNDTSQEALSAVGNVLSSYGRDVWISPDGKSIRKYCAVHDMDDIEHYALPLLYISLPMPAAAGEAGGVVDLKQHVDALPYRRILLDGSVPESYEWLAKTLAAHKRRFYVVRSADGRWSLGRFSPFRSGSGGSTPPQHMSVAAGASVSSWSTFAKR